MPNPENRPFLNIKEVSELLGISVSTINRLIKREKFPPKVKMSSRMMVFMICKIDKWIENQRNN